MGKYRGSRCRLCRREGVKLFLKGERCFSEKCSFSKRPSPPGVHGTKDMKASYYALQLREKQKVKRMYGMLERQFKRFFRLASRSKGVTGRVLLQLLERRLDNVIYRGLFAVSRPEARQIVRHGFVLINGKKVDIPSYLVEEGGVIEIKGDERIRKRIERNVEINSKSRSVCGWLDVDKENLRIKVLRLSEKEDLPIAINEQLIVELYSK